MNNESIEFYERNGDEFALGSASVDMSAIYREFLPLVPQPAVILDAGCGSGRDAKYFHDQGSEVEAFDASAKMVRISRATTSIDVVHCTFLDYSSNKKFDGIWACASLLHLEHDVLCASLEHLFGFLNFGGVFYASFKLGSGVRHDAEGRLFLDLDESALRVLTKELGGIAVEKMWITPDQRVTKQSVKWINIIWRKVS
tara:strand:- start:1693 stop:2289 length:597 start_codon:yes stop_codon:yes gene_type:complete